MASQPESAEIYHAVGKPIRAAYPAMPVCSTKDGHSCPLLFSAISTDESLLGST